MTLDFRQLTGELPGRSLPQQLVGGYVSKQKPAPTTMTDPIYVVIPSISTEISTPLPWPAIHGVTKPAQGAYVLIGYDENRVASVLAWTGTYS